MTCKEKLVKNHPGFNWDDVLNYDCPSDYGYLTDPDYCCLDCIGSCMKCWDREIPETNENKKDNEDMNYSYEDDVVSLTKQLDVCNATITNRNEEINKLVKELEAANRENKELKNLCDDLVAEYNQLEADTRGQDEEIEASNRRNTNQVNLIESLKTENRGLRTQISSYRQTNEDLGNQLTAVRIELTKAEKENETLTEQNKDLTKALEEKTEEAKEAWKFCKALKVDMEDKIAEKNNRIAELEKKIKDEQHLKTIQRLVMTSTYGSTGQWLKQNPYIRPIMSIDERAYIENDISSTKELAERFNSCSAKAINIRNKYEALIYVGFSHDDAMSLIPMWTDEED